MTSGERLHLTRIVHEDEMLQAILARHWDSHLRDPIPSWQVALDVGYLIGIIMRLTKALEHEEG